MDRNTVERTDRDWAKGASWSLAFVALQREGYMVGWEACAAAPGTPIIGTFGFFMSHN